MKMMQLLQGDMSGKFDLQRVLISYEYDYFKEHACMVIFMNFDNGKGMMSSITYLTIIIGGWITQFSVVDDGVQVKDELSIMKIFYLDWKQRKGEKSE